MNEEKKKNVNNKTFILIVAIATLMLSITGATYAYFALTINNANNITGTTATTSMTIAVEEQALKTPNTSKMVPQLSEAIPAAINSSNKCVDANGNIVCKVYKITITNTSSAGGIVNGTIKFTDYNTPNLRWRRIKDATSVDTATTGSYNASGVSVTKDLETDLISGSECVPSNASKRANCTNVSLAASGGTQTYYIVVWLWETGSDQTSVDAGKTFHATVKFEGANGTGVTSTIVS